MVQNFWQSPIRMGMGGMVDPMQWWNQQNDTAPNQAYRGVLPGDAGRANVASLKSGLGTPATDLETTTNQQATNTGPPQAASAWFDAPQPWTPRAANPSPPGAQPAGATQSSGTFGGQALPPDFSPWKNLYRYTTPGQTWGYDEASDTQRHDLAQNGALGEDNESRMFRWLNEAAAKAGYAGREGDAPIALQQQWFLGALGRLKNDYDKNGWDFRRSGFADFLPYLTGGGQAPAGATGGQPQAAAPQQQTTPRSGQTGGTPVATPGNNPYQQSPGGGGGSAMPNSPGANGIFPELAITNAARDPRAAYDMFLMQQNGGKLPTSHGFFDEFVSQYLGPMVSAALNATANAAGGQLPSTIEGLFNQIGGAMGGNNLFNLFSGLAQQGIQGMSGKLGNNAAGMADLIRSMAPLTSFGMNQQGRDAFYTSQDDTIRQAMAPTYYDPFLGANSDTDWGKYFAGTPFMRNYYPGGGQP